MLMTMKILKKLSDLRVNSGARIKLSLISLSCLWASQLQTCSTTVAYDDVEREVLPSPLRINGVPSPRGFGGLISPKQSPQTEI